MTDAANDMADFVLDDDELVFDDAGMPPPVEAPKKARRTPRKGADAAPPAAVPELPVSAAPAEAVADEPADTAQPIPRPDAAAAGSTSSDETAKDRRPLLLGALVGLSLVSSFASLGGLITVGRSLAQANAERARAAEDHAALARIGPIVATLDQASARLAAATARAPAPAGTPATLDDLHHAVDDLKLSLANSQPGGVAPLSAAVSSGFSDMASRLGQIDQEVQALSVPKGPTVVISHERAHR